MTPFLADLLIDTPCCAQHRLDGAGTHLPYPALTPVIHADEALQEENRARCRQKAVEPWQREDLTPRRLAMLLSPYSIRSHNVRLPDGTQRKSYRRSEFTAALRRHRPNLAVSPARHDERTA